PVPQVSIRYRERIWPTKLVAPDTTRSNSARVVRVTIYPYSNGCWVTMVTGLNTGSTFLFTLSGASSWPIVCHADWGTLCTCTQDTREVPFEHVACTHQPDSSGVQRPAALAIPRAEEDDRPDAGERR